MKSHGNNAHEYRFDPEVTVPWIIATPTWCGLVESFGSATQFYATYNTWVLTDRVNCQHAARVESDSCINLPCQRDGCRWGICLLRVLGYQAVNWTLFESRWPRYRSRDRHSGPRLKEVQMLTTRCFHLESYKRLSYQLLVCLRLHGQHRL
jgi:hypothetical protein